ncbi:MAG: putative glycolipid-binding domain-containing protein, partial [Janthinobacterium lividum]
RLEHDGAGRWLVDGAACQSLDGCLDVDLEASALTNTLPVHRFSLAEETGKPTAAPAAFVRAQTAAVERLEQSYRRLADGSDGPRFAYAAPVFDVSCVLAYDSSGLVLDYPGLAVRSGVAGKS